MRLLHYNCNSDPSDRRSCKQSRDVTCCNRYWPRQDPWLFAISCENLRISRGFFNGISSTCLVHAIVEGTLQGNWMSISTSTWLHASTNKLTLYYTTQNLNNDKYIQFYIIYSKAMNVFRLQKVQKVLGSRPQMFQVHFASFHHHAWKWTPLHGGNKLEQVGNGSSCVFFCKVRGTAKWSKLCYLPWPFFIYCPEYVEPSGKTWIEE